VTFHRRGLREPHPFTVSSGPSEATLRLTIRSAGRSTARVHRDHRRGERSGHRDEVDDQQRTDGR
jgi:predicted ferric reductase